MPNPHCTCPVAGFCQRHQIEKGQREHALCQGVADTADCGRKYWLAWERGKLGATAPEEPVLKPEGFCEGERVAVSKAGCCGGGKKKSAPQKLWAYVSALANWKLAGSPVRSDEETARIYHEECKPCEHFQKDESCGLCGCRLSPTDPAMANKIRMATEHCPIGKW